MQINFYRPNDSIIESICIVKYISRINNSFLPELSHLQIRDALMWGGFALLSVFIAVSSHFLQLDSSYLLSSDLRGNGENRYQVSDPVHTGSVLPNTTDQTNRLASGKPAISFPRTTIAIRQPGRNVTARLGSNDIDIASANSTRTPSSEQNIVGINLGSAHSFSSLARHYTALVNVAPLLFSALEPRASIVEKDTGIEAHLIAGPLKNIDVAKRLCAKIRLRVDTGCTPTKFTGMALSLN